MPFSHQKARPGTDAATRERPDESLTESENPWRDAAGLLARKARGHAGLILACALACGMLAGLAKTVLPANYKASAQILIDPQENRALGAATEAPANLEASAAVNYVESQMGVIGSERVLLRVIRDQGLAGAASEAVAKPGESKLHETKPGEESQESEDQRRARELSENKALIILQKAVKVLRAERSFLVNITVEDKSPEKAARIANAVVKAYGEVNQVDRNAAGRSLSVEMSRRIEDMRRMLGNTETRLLNYKTEHNLVGLHDKAIIERRTNETTEVLTAAENREAQARARLKQLEAGPASMGGVAALGSDPESRQLLGLIEGRAAARAEVDQYAATLGERHPALAAAREKSRDFDRRVEQSVEALRHTARSQLAEAQAQTAALTKKLADLAQEMSKARESDVSLQQLEDAVEGKRKALTALEARQRDANDMSHVEGVAFRIVSPARIPNTQGGIVGLALWSLCGGLIGAALALAGLAATAIFDAPADAIPDEPAAASIGLDWFEPAASRAAAKGAAMGAVSVLPAITSAPGRRLSPVDAMEEVERRPDQPFAQAVEALYLRLKKTRSAASGPLVVLVAGTEPQAGASTLAANLARIASAHGERALLIDAHQDHPALDLMIPANAPNTLIELAGLERPLYRLEPFSQSLSLIPALAKEQAVCRAIAGQSAYRRIAGLKGNFDFVVFDGPDASDVAALRALVPVAGQVLLVAPDESAEPGLPRLLRRIGVEPNRFFACLRAPLRRPASNSSRTASRAA
jgi:uncharacterized protein involved in exopolysaccharide biosynthesis/Mrp family chromosome partitioning ATPase